MKLLRQAILLFLVGLAFFFAWKNLSRAAQETAVLHTVDATHHDRFTTLWLVEDGYHVWIRAENRQRAWLSELRTNPRVELRREHETFRYEARPFDDPRSIAYVDALFREKYGFADWTRGLLGDRDPLPIRLETR